ncbi:MAG: SAM-dependent methyltransferase [Acidimicrobiales bacterium]|nr:MAG: SAM-dependent methyltransferase [Acidimicrobiales bacterium]
MVATCPACGSANTESLMTIPAMPVHVGLLWTSRDAATGCDQAEMALSLCAHCGYVWNAAFDIEKMDYEQDYDNALHHSPKFATWEADLAKGLVARHGLRGRRLAEIGPGDGRFLANLAIEGGNTGIGIEPGHNPDRVSDLVAQADVEIHDEYADADSLRGHEVDFVSSRHVLEHLPEPMMLIDTIRGGIVQGGGVYIEVPNFSWALDRGAFEDLMYEHCGYYTPETLAHLMSRAGFSEIVAAPTFDGLFAAVEAVVAAGVPHNDPIDPAIVDRIRADVHALAARIDAVSTEFAARRDSGQKLAAWGGGARAVGLLNLVPDADAIEWVVDINPRKQGTFVTGTGHAIVAPDTLRETRPDAVLVVNPVYTDEIARMLTDLGVDADLISI